MACQFHHLRQCRLLRGLLCRHISSSRPSEVPPAGASVAIVGAGPAGFYTAQKILKTMQSIPVTVDMFEKLPVPYGLVRFGVAPDHPEVKNVINSFNNTARNENFSFLGNVNVGKDITVEQLRQHYTAVVLAYGSEDDKMLGIPGEDLPGVTSARSFVGWYNGLPQDKDLEVNLDTDTVAVLGQGNVALDVARILVTPIDQLRKTDICEHAVETLLKSRVERVYLIGRRGPLQVAFTTAEIREMIKLNGTRPLLDKKDFDQFAELPKDLARARKRMVTLMYNTACGEPSVEQQTNWENASKSWGLRFLRSPIEFLPNKDGTRVNGIRLRINKLTGEVNNQKIEPTSETEDFHCGLVLRSIGYQSLPIESSVPFDSYQAIIPNSGGRVKDQPGLYCSGWVKRGPTGVIATTMNDAIESGSSVANDINKGNLTINPQHRGKQAILEILQQKGIKPVTFEGWENINRAEVEKGQAIGKPREKLIDINEMIQIANS